MASHPAPATTSSERRDVLCCYGLLDTPPEAPFDRIVVEAAREFGVSAAAITLVTPERCWFKARVGLAVTEVPITYGFCGYAYTSSGTVIVTDAERHSQFSRSPIVTENGFRFYVGVPLRSPEGHALGTLCVLDQVPLYPTPQQLERLRELATKVMELFESRRRPTSPLPPPAPKNTMPPSRTTVLIVDDELSIRSFISRVIGFRGLPTLTAANGTEALAVFRDHASAIGLVLTDLAMPQMDGLALIRELQESSTPPPIAVMSGRLEPDFQRALDAAGITCILQKPFTISDLDRALALLPACRTAALIPQPA